MEMSQLGALASSGGLLDSLGRIKLATKLLLLLEQPKKQRLHREEIRASRRKLFVVVTASLGVVRLGIPFHYLAAIHELRVVVSTDREPTLFDRVSL